jgi:hypothetical protein
MRRAIIGREFWTGFDGAEADARHSPAVSVPRHRLPSD